MRAPAFLHSVPCRCLLLLRLARAARTHVMVKLGLTQRNHVEVELVED